MKLLQRSAFIWVLWICVESPLGWSGNNSWTTSKEGDKIFLHDDSCDDLKARASALLQWRKTLEPSSDQIEADCTFDAKSQLHSIEVTQSLPTSAKNLLLKGGVSYAGPNCFNTILHVRQMAEIRYSKIKELVKWFLFSGCEDVSTKARLPGDIGIRKFPEGDVDGHAFFYISNDLIFHKPNDSKTSTWEFSTLQKEMDDLAGIEDSVTHAYFRCPVRKAKPIDLKTPLGENVQKFKEIECRANNSSDRALLSQMATQLKDIQNVISKQLQAFDSKGKVRSSGPQTAQAFDSKTPGVDPLKTQTDTQTQTETQSEKDEWEMIACAAESTSYQLAFLLRGW